MAYEERKVDIAFGVSEFKVTGTKNRKPVSDRKVSLEQNGFWLITCLRIEVLL